MTLPRTIHRREARKRARAAALARARTSNVRNSALSQIMKDTYEKVILEQTGNNPSPFAINDHNFRYR